MKTILYKIIIINSMLILLAAALYPQQNNTRSMFNLSKAFLDGIKNEDYDRVVALISPDIEVDVILDEDIKEIVDSLISGAIGPIDYVKQVSGGNIATFVDLTEAFGNNEKDIERKLIGYDLSRSKINRDDIQVFGSDEKLPVFFINVRVSYTETKNGKTETLQKNAEIELAPLGNKFVVIGFII